MAKKKKLKAKIAELETELMQMRKDMQCLIIEPNSHDAQVIRIAYKQGRHLENLMWKHDPTKPIGKFDGFVSRMR